MDGKPTTPTEESPATSSALASLLSTTLAQVDSLKDKLKKEKQRADHFEGLATDYKELLAKDDKKQKQEDGDDSPESPATDTLAVAAEKIKQLRESISVAELVRDEEMARRLAITDLWAQLNQYIDRLETAGRDVRAGFDKVVKSGGGVIRDMFKDVPQLADGDLMRVDRHYNANGVLQQHGTRRPRSDSMDAYAYPNSKRVRYQEEHPPSFYPGHTLSPPHIQHAMMPYPQGQPAFAAPSGSRRRHADPAGAMHPPDHQGNLYPVPLNYEHERRSRRGRARSRSYSHGRSPSRGSDGSADLDEMLLATTGDQPNGNGVPGGPQVLVSGRRKDLASHGSPFVYDPREGSQFVHQVPQHSLSPHSQHPPAHHYLGAPPPHPQYAQPPSGRHSPAFNSSSRPNSSRRSLRGEPTLRDDASIVHVTHVFAPVQTGAPIKKSKFNNNSSSSANIAEESHSNSPAPNPPLAPTNTLPLASVNLAPATSPFPPTNEQGQRICRQCGMPGRYKEGKCVEKWGPGPMGPGTVCDRCRKKMKRVERRGTIEQAQLLAAQQAQNRSQPNVGNGNGSSGHPPPHEQRSFSVPQRDSTAKLGRTDTVIVDSSGRETPTHSFQEPAISSIRSTSNARVVASSASKSTPSKATSRPASKAASRAGSIAASSTKGSRRSSPVPSSRSNLGTSMTIAAAYTSNASNASVHSNGSNSGMDIDADADGDGDADGDPDDAEVEGDLAALVDQAGPSPPRPSSGSRQHRNNNSNHIRNDDVDIATLAGVDDDDPDDYDSPATTNALRRQQAARVSGGPAKAGVGEVTSGPESADGDAELDLLEAVDAAEANSSTSS